MTPPGIGRSVRRRDAVPDKPPVRGPQLLETTFTTVNGSVMLTDALAVGRNERGHEVGAGAVSTVPRRMVGVAGSVDMETPDDIESARWRRRVADHQLVAGLPSARPVRAT
jgi:hypothetical protein